MPMNGEAKKKWRHSFLISEETAGSRCIRSLNVHCCVRDYLFRSGTIDQKQRETMPRPRITRLISELSIFVPREEPDEIIIDSFAARYALIVGLAVPGTVLLLISIVFLHFGRRKF